MTAIGKNYWRLDFFEPNMKLTRDLYMQATAKKMVACAIPAILVVGFLELAIKNTVFILANCVIAIINAVSYLIHRIRALFSSAHPPQRIINPEPEDIVDLENIERPAINYRNRILRRNVVNEPPPLPNQQFAADDLATFRAALVSATTANNAIFIQVDETLYAVWNDAQDGSINIQDSINFHAFNQGNKISVKIDAPGRITSIKINDVNHNQIPDEFLPRFRNCFIKSLELSSKYQVVHRSIEIQIIRRGLKDIPSYHLDELAKCINRHPNHGTNVKFLKNNLEFDEGVDGGGLSRDYLDDLFQNVTKLNALRFKRNPNTSLLMPVALAGNNGALPILNFEENQIYRQIGQVMMYYYKYPGNYLIGKHFGDGLFKAAFSLTPGEIDTPFENLSLGTRLKMCEAIASANDDYHRDIQLARKGHMMTNAEVRDLEEILHENGDLPDDFDHDNFDPGDEAQRTAVQQAIVAYIFSRETVGEALPAIHSIAKGMKQMLGAIQPAANYGLIEFQEFNRKIQGSIDRAYVAGQVELRGDVAWQNRAPIQRKVNWLKEWITDEQNGATNEELLKFIKYVSGASSLPNGRRIEVIAQTAWPRIPVPVAHSCFYQMEISAEDAAYGRHNDRTKENFIQAFRELALTDPTGYHMG